MKPDKSEETRKARLAMYGRILRCPVANNPDDCPLHTIRQLPIEERITWLQSKTDEEVLDLYLQHIDCLNKKVNTRPEKRPFDASKVVF